jgi:DNA-binding SARP family transcriptional activator
MGLSLEVLGEFALFDGYGKVLTLPTRKTRALLAYLAVNADKPQRRRQLMSLLWGDRGDQQARQSLNQALATIRKLASDQGETILEGGSDWVSLRSDAVEVDIARFRALSNDDPAQACELYKGPLLNGLSLPDPAFDEWLTTTRSELHGLACDTLERAAEAAASAGNTDSAITFAQQLVRLDPLREDAHRRLIRLLYDNGDRAAAIRQYQTCVDTLEKELNVGPDATTRELFETISTDMTTSGRSASRRDSVGQSTRSLIAVLPFKNMSADADLDVLADGLVEDTIAGLERFHIVSVVSSTSSNRYRVERPNARVIGAELGAAYLLEGSVRKAGKFIRISAQVIDVATDQSLWAQRYDRPLENPFDLQDEVSAGIIAAIEPVLINAELGKGRRTEPGFGRNAKASEAAWHLYRFARDNNAKAISLLEEVIAENPDVPGRHEALARAHMYDVTFGWTTDPGYSINQAKEAVEKANELEPDDAYRLAVLAWTYAHSGDWARAIANIDRAIEIHPASAVPHGVKAWIFGHYGEPEIAIQSLEMMLARTTESPFVFQYLCGGALGHLALEHWDEAARLAETATVRRPNSLTGWVIQTVAHYHAGNEADAARRFLNLIELKPDMTEEWLRALLPIRSPDLKERIYTSLRALGLPA